MSHLFTESIGYISGLLITVSLLPQVIKSWKTKSTKDLSIPWLTIYIIGLALNTYYGFLIDSYPIILTTFVELLLAISLFTLKLLHK